MTKNPMNVLTRWRIKWHYTPFRRIKYAWQRIARGWADSDIWDFDMFIETIIANGLRQLAKTAHGYPGTEEFNTPEKWENWLNDHAQRIENFISSEEGGVEEEKERHEDMKAALHEIINYIEYLWD